MRNIIGSRFLLVLGLVLYLAGYAQSQSIQSIQFPSASSSHKIPVTGDLYRPEREGSLPAVLVLHTCGGVHDHDHDQALRLKKAGYVALVVDSFSSRDVERCKRGNIGKHISDYVEDARGALAHLRTLPFVDSNRTAAMGFSLGGAVAIELSKKSQAMPKGHIRAAVAFYPGRFSCRNWTGAIVPVLFFYGESDNWTPPSQCVAAAKKLLQQGQTVEWKIYPGAYHRFDARRRRRRVTKRGYILEYNHKAAKDSWKRALGFLDQHVRKVN